MSDASWHGPGEAARNLAFKAEDLQHELSIARRQLADMQQMFQLAVKDRDEARDLACSAYGRLQLAGFDAAWLAEMTRIHPWFRWEK